MFKGRARARGTGRGQPASGGALGRGEGPAARLGAGLVGRAAAAAVHRPGARGRPEMLLMDEPASALDPIATQRIEELIFELKRDYTIVIVTHNMQQAARVSDVDGVLLAGRAGRIRADRPDLHEPGAEADRGLHHGTVRLTAAPGGVPLGGQRQTWIRNVTSGTFRTSSSRSRHGCSRWAASPRTVCGWPCARSSIGIPPSSSACSSATTTSTSCTSRSTTAASRCWRCISRWPWTCARSWPRSRSTPTSSASATSPSTSPKPSPATCCTRRSRSSSTSRGWRSSRRTCSATPWTPSCAATSRSPSRCSTPTTSWTR